jgi:hypothetical protein
MNRETAMTTLRAHLDDIRAFGVLSLSLFGSVARDEARPGSDVDVLVQFESPASFDQYMGLKLFLEDLLGTRVDLVTPGGLRPRLRPSIEAGAIRVA